MIKKLVKYGNSQALVLDKALLEILNITDTTKLKLTTDGKSLVITPLSNDAQTPMNDDAQTPTISVTEGEALKHYSQSYCTDPKNLAAFEEMGTETFREFQAEFKVMWDAFDKKYDYIKRVGEVIQSPAYKEAAAEFDQHFRATNGTPEEYIRESAKLLQKFVPEIPLEELGKKCQELGLKYKK